MISEEKVTFEVLFCKKHCYVFMDIFVKDLKRKNEKDLTPYVATEMRNCLQTFMFFHTHSEVVSQLESLIHITGLQCCLDGEALLLRAISSNSCTKFTNRNDVLLTTTLV